MDKQDASLVFDLDDTLIDSVYQHVMAWSEAMRASSIDLSVWRIHRRMGMSGGLFVKALARELGHEPSDAVWEKLQRDHETAYLRYAESVVPLPGAGELLAALTNAGVGWAIATSGARETALRSLRMLEIPKGTPIITRDEVQHAKPNPDLFIAAMHALGSKPNETFVVGDSLWDMLGARRAGALSVGVLSGGYGRAELIEGGAYRVYNDPAGLLLHLDELGLRGIV